MVESQMAEPLAPLAEPLAPLVEPLAPLARLRELLAEMEQVVVAFSGGVDSAFLAYVATDVLGADHAHCVTAVSPSLAADELADCEALASEWGLNWSKVSTNEMDNQLYRLNSDDRCAHCKTALMDAIDCILTAPAVVPVAAAPATAAPATAGTAPAASATAGGSSQNAVITLGVNLDDLADHRPGQKAAKDRGARFPLVEAGFTKAAIREHSRELGLNTWDKPAAACLASRIPYGTQVTVALLGRIERAEAALRRLGIKQLRVRDYDDTARIEVPITDFEQVIVAAAEVAEAVKAAGYRYVTLDLEGFRSGNLNASLKVAESSQTVAESNRTVATSSSAANEPAEQGEAGAFN